MTILWMKNDVVERDEAQPLVLIAIVDLLVAYVMVDNHPGLPVMLQHM